MGLAIDFSVWTIPIKPDDDVTGIASIAAVTSYRASDSVVVFGNLGAIGAPDVPAERDSDGNKTKVTGSIIAAAGIPLRRHRPGPPGRARAVPGRVARSDHSDGRRVAVDRRRRQGAAAAAVPTVAVCGVSTAAATRVSAAAVIRPAALGSSMVT